MTNLTVITTRHKRGRVPEIFYKGYRCIRCDHTWVPRKAARPKVCPKCKSAYWDTPYQTKRDPKA